ncbi:MAG: hypothetical protein JSW15_03100 [Deltaproteobacteria bacterium]|nr:MAG: hypothetical protein JSW15_03100 [Deltaproteobacteria bacterium]
MGFTTLGFCSGGKGSSSREQPEFNKNSARQIEIMGAAACSTPFRVIEQKPGLLAEKNILKIMQLFEAREFLQY